MRSYVLAAIAALGALSWSGSAGAHPSLYFDATEQGELRALVKDATDTGLGWSYAKVFEEIVAAADKYKAEKYTYTVEIPDFDGQGSATWTYTLSSNMPGDHPNNASYPPWTKVSRDLQRRMEVLSFAFVMTDNAEYWSNAQGTGALDIAKAVSSWKQWTDPYYPCGGETCLDTAHLSLGVGMAYDLGYAGMSDADRKLLRDAIANKGATPLAADTKKANSTSGGIGAWFNGYALRVAGLAVGACAVAEELPSQTGAWTTLARDSVLAFYNGQGKDGGTFEGQLYGSYAVDNLVVAAHVLDKKNAGAGLFDHAWLKGVPRFAAAFLGNDNRTLAPLGDSSPAAYWSMTMYALASRGDAVAQWYLVKTGNARPQGFLPLYWARPKLQPTPIPGSGTSLYQDVGHAVLRAGFDGAPVLAVKSGPPTVQVGHNHLDHNSFSLSAHGQWVASDPGYEDYFNASKHLFTTSSIGHNTILVDKSVSSDGGTVTGMQTKKFGGKLDYLFDGSAYAKVVGQAAATYEDGLLDRFGRRFFYARPDLVFVFDDLGAPKAHGYSFLLHSGAEGLLEPGTGPGELVSSLRGARLQAYLVSSSPLAPGYPKAQSHPGAESYGPYGEWRSQSVSSVRFAAAIVPGLRAHVTFDNPGFEKGLASWQPRFDDGTHTADSKVAHSGTSSGRIENATSKTGYYYSENMSLVPGSSVTATVYARSSGANGTISVQPFYTLAGAYLTDPAGEAESIDAATATDWTEIVLKTTAPADGVDGVRIALQFSGSGTVWFDDASYAVGIAPPETALSTAVSLGDPPAGLVVSGPWGVDVAASFVGSGKSGTVTLKPASQDIPQVTEVSTDGDLFAFGLEKGGGLRRAFLQGGTQLLSGGKTVVKASKAGSFDVAVQRGSDGCVRVEATEVATLEAPPYTVGVVAAEVWLGGERVPFTVQGDTTVFPAGTELGAGCESPEAGIEAGSEAGVGGDGSILADAADAVGGKDSSAADAIAAPAAPEESSGCGCRVLGRKALGEGSAAWGMAALAVLGSAGARRKRRGT